MASRASPATQGPSRASGAVAPPRLAGMFGIGKGGWAEKAVGRPSSVRMALQGGKLAMAWRMGVGRGRGAFPVPVSASESAPSPTPPAAAACLWPFLPLAVHRCVHGL